MKQAARLVVMISGNGSNLQAILDAICENRLSASVVAVISNQPEAFGLERALSAGVPALVKQKTKGQDRTVYDQELAELAASFDPDWIVLAGWMRILSASFLDKFPNRVINLHPALPGMFAGVHAIERAYAAYQRGEIDCTGVMVHLVPDDGVDCGPVLNQSRVEIFPGDTLADLEARIHETEHILLVKTLNQLVEKREVPNA